MFEPLSNPEVAVLKSTDLALESFIPIFFNLVYTLFFAKKLKEMIFILQR